MSIGGGKHLRDFDADDMDFGDLSFGNQVRILLAIRSRQINNVEI